jgi:hypothetical protein
LLLKEKAIKEEIIRTKRLRIPESVRSDLIGPTHDVQPKLGSHSASLFRRELERAYDLPVRFLPNGKSLPRKWFRPLKRVNRNKKKMTAKQKKLYKSLLLEWAAGVIYVRLPPKERFPRGSSFSNIIKDHYVVALENSSNKVGLARYLAGLSCRHPDNIINFHIHDFRDFMIRTPFSVSDRLGLPPHNIRTIDLPVITSCRKTRRFRVVKRRFYGQLGNKVAIRVSEVELLTSPKGLGTIVFLDTWRTPRLRHYNRSNGLEESFDGSFGYELGSYHNDPDYLETSGRDEIPIYVL